MHTRNLAHLFDLLDTLPNPVTLNQIAFDENGVQYDKIIYVNKSFLKTIGYTVKDIPNDKTWFKTAYPDAEYRDYITNEWFKAVDKAQSEDSDLAGFPANVMCKDGQKRWFHITTQLSHPISNQYRTIIFMQTESPDEVKLKLDEASLNLIYEKRLLRTILDTVPIRIFWKDKNGVYLGCNNAFLHDAHLNDESEIIGKTDYDMIWKDDAQNYRDDDKTVLESGIPKLNFIENQTQSNGELLVLSTSKVPLVNTSGEKIGILGIYLDITNEYKSRIELKETENLLQIQSRQAAMGELLSMIAHQWRQPLSIISAIVSNIHIAEALGTTSLEERTKQLNSISDQITFLSQTITDFRNFFKQDKEKHEILASDLVNQAIMLVGKLLENNNIDLLLSYKCEKPLLTYTNELQHVFINLIKNAADILIEKNQNEKWVSISCEENSDSITFIFSDNGGGIDEALMNRIFEPYFSTKKEKNGTGLGLYMSKIIIEKHLKGSISCTNSDVGAVFTIKLPITF